MSPRRERPRADVVNLAFARAERHAGEARAVIDARAMPGGESVGLVWTGVDGRRYRMVLTRAEARALREAMMRAEVHARYEFERAHDIVKLAWCDTRGRPTTERRVRGRVVERTDTAVRVSVEPERYHQEPREGWPAAGWYRLDGWAHGHVAGRRGWCVVSGPAPHAPRVPS